MSDILTTLLTGSVMAAIITGKFGDRNAIHGESEWRQDLFSLSKKTKLLKKDIELFRTCLSSIRGIPFQINRPNYYEYDPYFKKNETIDDFCIVYYYYLRNCFYNKDICCIDGEDDIFVFRQLCRLLVKTDWNRRTYTNILNCEKLEYNYPCIKAYVILKRKLKNTTYVQYINNYKIDKYLKKVDTNDKNNLIVSNNKIIEMVKYRKIKLLLLILLYVLFIIEIFKELLYSHFGKFSLKNITTISENKIIFILLIIISILALIQSLKYIFPTKFSNK